MSQIKGLGRIIHDFKKHPWLHFVSISTITVSLVILGVFFLAFRNIEQLAQKESPQITGTLYLKEALNETQLAAIKEKISAIEGVEKIVFKAKQTVLQDLQTFLGNTSAETVPGGELFPDILEVVLKADVTQDQIEIAKLTVAKIPEISEIDFSEDWLAQYKNFQGVLKIVGIVIISGILLACSFIISNFMGIRHQARKYELEIVRLMGAQKSFMLVPFLWEGMIEGLIGAILAIPLLYIIKTAAATWVSIQWVNLLGFKDFSFLSVSQLALLVAIGVGMAFLGSITVLMRLREKSAT